MRYAVVFGLSALALTLGTIASFRQISRNAITRDSLMLPPADTLTGDASAAPVMPARAEYARFDSVDRAWRAGHAHAYTLAELRARGDGRRTPRELMEERVYNYSR